MPGRPARQFGPRVTKEDSSDSEEDTSLPQLGEAGPSSPRRRPHSQLGIIDQLNEQMAVDGTIDDDESSEEEEDEESSRNEVSISSSEEEEEEEERRSSAQLDPTKQSDQSQTHAKRNGSQDSRNRSRQDPPPRGAVVATSKPTDSQIQSESASETETESSESIEEARARPASNHIHSKNASVSACSESGGGSDQSSDSPRVIDPDDPDNPSKSQAASRDPSPAPHQGTENGHAIETVSTGQKLEDAAGDESASEEASDDDDEDGDEEEQEPTLKYQRIRGTIAEVLVKDSASALAVADRILVLGTHNGMVHVLSLDGSKIKTYRPHSASVNDIKIDEDGEFVATASVDGRVVVAGITNTELYAFDLKRPMKAIALEPAFNKSSSRAFVCGGMAGTLVLHEKGWLGHKERILHSGEGPIYAIRWIGNLIIWANDIGVKIHDTATDSRIAYIDRPKGSPRPDAFRCTLLWEPPHSLIIAWADYIKVDSMISGISSSGSDGSFLIVAYVPPDDFGDEAAVDSVTQRRKAANRPELRIISRSGEELSSDALSLTGYERYSCNDYWLVKSRQEEAFYVVSPKDIVLARPRDETDHVNWLVEQERFVDALQAARSIPTVNVQDIGERYMHYLFAKGEYDQVAELTPEVLNGHAKAWEDWIFEFVRVQRFSAITPFVPVSKPRLSRLIYDMILAHYLAHDRQPAEALPYMLRTRRADVFDFIKKHNLFASVKDQVQLLVAFDEETRSVKTSQPGGAIDMLVQHTHAIPVDQVVSQLEMHPRSLYRYLAALFEKDSLLASDYADRQVNLCAQYDPSALLPFLRASNYYSLEKAYRICEKADLVPEMVFLLGRMGNNKQALTLIIQRLRDVKRAIEFAKEQADEDLWEDLLRYSEDKPTFIRGLLENVGGEIDPLRVIQRIRTGLKIPGLRSAIITILQSSNLQSSLLEGCRKILATDAVDLALQLQRKQAAAGSACAVCSEPLYRLDDPDSTSPVVVLYFCRHAVHATCAMRNEGPEVADSLPARPDTFANFLYSEQISQGRSLTVAKHIGEKLAYTAQLRLKIGPCPACRHSFNVVQS